MQQDFNRDTAQWVATYNRQQYRPGNHARQPLEEIEEVPGPLDWAPIITTLLLGTRDTSSPLSLLIGKEEDLIQHILKLVIYKYQEGAVTITPPAHVVSRIRTSHRRTNTQHEEEEDEMEPTMVERGRTWIVMNTLLKFEFNRIVRIERVGPKRKDRPQIAFSPCCNVKFPTPTGININMMPFIMGNRDSLPENLWPYYDNIVVKCPVDESEQGQVMYLSVQEGVVEAKDTQRRPGLHIEAPAASIRHSGEFAAGIEQFRVRRGYGDAHSPDELHGGLYLASNTRNTTAVWDALVDSKLGAVDTHGGIEHLRPYIGMGKKLPGGLLIWMTDSTPHEALPQEVGGYRQFFRLVTAEISVWYAKHSTPNPKVPVPSHVKIIGESKFKDPKTSVDAALEASNERKPSRRVAIAVMEGESI